MITGNNIGIFANRSFPGQRGKHLIAKVRPPFRLVATQTLYDSIYYDGAANRTDTGVRSGIPFNVFTNPVTLTTNYTLVSLTDSLNSIRTNGFTQDSASIIIKIIPTASICCATGGIHFACGGPPAALTASGAGAGGAYLWNGGDSIHNAVNYFEMDGNYTVTITDSSGCSAEDSMTVVIGNPFTATLSATNCSTDSSNNGSITVTVSGGSGGALWYSWSTGSQTFNNSITGLAPGTYWVTITDYEGSGPCPDYFVGQATITVTGIETLIEYLTFNICPNPARDLLNFQWGSDIPADLAIYDVTGKLVKSFSVHGQDIYHFDINDLSPGAYLIRVTERQSNSQHCVLFSKY